MTVKETLAKLKALGCKARWDMDWREYRVTLPNLSHEREEAIAYYTSDPEDALATGEALASNAAKIEAQERWLAHEAADTLDLY
jgi:hypothetical protein